MPILNVKVATPKTADSSHCIAAVLLDLTSRILGNKPEVTSIAIAYVDP